MYLASINLKRKCRYRTEAAVTIVVTFELLVKSVLKEDS